MENEKINAFLDAVDKAKAGDETAFDGISITLDGEINESISASGLENKKKKGSIKND